MFFAHPHTHTYAHPPRKNAPVLVLSTATSAWRPQGTARCRRTGGTTTTPSGSTSRCVFVSVFFLVLCMFCLAYGHRWFQLPFDRVDVWVWVWVWCRAKPFIARGVPRGARGEERAEELDLALFYFCRDTCGGRRLTTMPWIMPLLRMCSSGRGGSRGCQSVRVGAGREDGG